MTARATWTITFAMLLAAYTARAADLQNGDFGDGLTGWMPVSVAPGSFSGFPRFENPSAVACLPSREGNPRLSINVPGNADGYVWQQVQIDDSGGTLSFVTWGNHNPTTVTASVQTVGDDVVHDLETFVTPSLEQPPGCSGLVPVVKSYDLAPFAGQVVAVRLRATAPGYNGTIANFDDVMIVEPTTTTTTTSTTTSTTQAPGCSDLAGAAAVACLCDGGLPAACSGERLPKAIGKGRTTACAKATRGLQAGATRKGRRLLTAAAHRASALDRIARRPKLHASAACVDALVTLFGGMHTHIEEVRGGL